MWGKVETRAPLAWANICKGTRREGKAPLGDVYQIRVLRGGFWDWKDTEREKSHVPCSLCCKDLSISYLSGADRFHFAIANGRYTSGIHWSLTQPSPFLGPRRSWSTRCQHHTSSGPGRTRWHFSFPCTQRWQCANSTLYMSVLLLGRWGQPSGFYDVCCNLSDAPGMRDSVCDRSKN